VLPFVSKPGRYVGNELHAIAKDHRDKFRIALAFPDIYEIGMSYIGQQILYHLINSRDDCLAERVFQVWPDMESALRKAKIPLFSLETATPLGDFDVIGFSMTYELHAPGVLNILDLAGIPFKAIGRDEKYPLIIAGGPAILNPEPVADFFDAMFLGDGEEAVQEMIDVLIEKKNETKENKLSALAGIEGVYIPSFYQPEYERSRFKAIKPIVENAPEKIKIRSCLALKEKHYPAQPIVPFIETTHDRLTVEIMRGCVAGCRFCQAGYQYRPRRIRPGDDIYSQIQNGIRSSGYDEVTLLSLSATDYPELETMVAGIMPFLQQNRISLSLPSLRPGSLSPIILEYLKSQRKSGITIAPEAGTQCLRNVLGKNITDDEIYDTVNLVFKNDWTLIKLYFMIGLPTETENDIGGIIDMIKNISRIASAMGGKKNINVTISPFCPKPGTPWQWESQLSDEQVGSIYNRLRKEIKNRNVALKFRDPKLAVLEGVVGRGDRRLSGAIIKAYNNGARLDGWSEHFKFENWENALKADSISIDDSLRFKIASMPLPWEHIDKGISKKFLLDERDRSLKGELPPGSNIVKDSVPKKENMAFGRSVRKKSAVSRAPIKTKIRLRYSRDERLRFYSHLDMIRVFTRAIRRASLPVSYSEGFTPRMKLAFGPPLAMGYVSRAEYLDIQLDSPFEKGHLAGLNENLPPGMSLTDSKLIFTKTDSLTKIINSASYEVEVGKVDNEISARINDLLKNRAFSVIRVKKDERIEVDVGRFLYDLSFHDGLMEMLLGFTPEGYIRPNEVLEFGLGFSTEEALSLIYARTGQYLLQGVHKVEPLDLV
jgi:radical SAM family uncharacterized protein/radical SAM-linked protein